MIGGGYVGLVSGACFAALGADVTIVEADPGRFDVLRGGSLPIYEPGLAELVAAGRAAGLLRFANDMNAVKGADIIFLAVGTPTRRGDGHADLSFVFDAVEDIAPRLTGPAVLVTKSTVPVGTGRRVAALLAKSRPDIVVSVASNPEFLREGSAIEDFMRPDRVVVGTECEAARIALASLYAKLTKAGAPFVCTNIETAEMIKYAANAFLAMKISFINEMADLCEKVDADVDDLAFGLGLDPRVGARFLQPGPGFGGSCFPKDTQALVRIAQDAGAPSRLIETVVAINDARKATMATRIIAACGGAVRGKRIAILGLTFKPDTDDVRDSPAIGIIHRLVDEGAIISTYDPMGMNHARFQLPARVSYCDTALLALRDADVAVLVTEWAEFIELAPDQMRAAMRGRKIVDLRNALNAGAMRAAGFDYLGLGRPQVPSEIRQPVHEPFRHGLAR
jgi:UDPglucose 6-dehydrogenase